MTRGKGAWRRTDDKRKALRTSKERLTVKRLNIIDFIDKGVS